MSWQFENSNIVRDSANKLLTGEIQPTSLPKHIDGTVVSLLSGGGSNYNYFHWLYDSLPRLRLCEPLIENNAPIKYLVSDNSFPFQRETLKYLGFDKNQQLSSKKFSHIKCNSAVLTSHPNPNQNRIPRWITNFLREKFLHLTSTLHGISPFIYISREDNTNNRRLINEDELLEILRNYGFQTHQLSNLTFKDQVSLFANAKIIVGVHGAGFANLSFCNSEATVIELFSNSYQPKMYAGISKNLNLNYKSFSFPDTSKQNKPDKTASIFLSEKDLEKIKTTLENLV